MNKAREILIRLGVEPSNDDCIAVQHVSIVAEIALLRIPLFRDAASLPYIFVNVSEICAVESENSLPKIKAALFILYLILFCSSLSLDVLLDEYLSSFRFVPLCLSALPT